MPGVSLPTRWRDWRLMGRTIRLVLSNPVYAGLAVALAVVSLSAFVFPRNLDLLVNVVLAGELPLGTRVAVLVQLYPGLGPAYTPTTGVLLVIVAALAGIDLALVGYYVRERELSVREGTGGLTGVVLGTLGAGCASCGSVILAGLLSLAGAGSALAALPLDGAELLIVALLSVVLSIHWIADGLDGSAVEGCRVDLGRD